MAGYGLQATTQPMEGFTCQLDAGGMQGVNTMTARGQNTSATWSDTAMHRESGIESTCQRPTEAEQGDAITYASRQPLSDEQRGGQSYPDERRKDAVATATWCGRQHQRGELPPLQHPERSRCGCDRAIAVGRDHAHADGDGQADALIGRWSIGACRATSSPIRIPATTRMTQRHDRGCRRRWT